MDAFDKLDGVAAAAQSLQHQADTMLDAAYAANRTAVKYRRYLADRARTRPFMPAWDGSLRAAGGYCPSDDVTGRGDGRARIHACRRSHDRRRRRNYRHDYRPQLRDLTMSAKEITELKRTIAQLDADYTKLAMDRAELAGRVEKLLADLTEARARIADRDATIDQLIAHRDAYRVERDASLLGQDSLKRERDGYREAAHESRELLEAAERDLDRQDVVIAALKSANELLSMHRHDFISELNASASSVEFLTDENRRLRDVIVHQAALLAGCGE